ncbi:hypothetical protein [Paraburkholderia bryophila]|uniref:Uncharacterized protein n=1 Tax=Paraburkholderia bryophila TaxID=420952 RepID=A0A7Y9WL67_9BURK|nr:hypothetical protein [Paraburkholderia bryophila]NYH22886.1 hypothetical protein [Paraburkholderia bryophila]
MQYDLKEDIAALRGLLSEHRGDPRRQHFRDMYETIQELIDAGVSHARIIRKLKDRGFGIAPVTFKSWLAEIQQEREAIAVTGQPAEDVSQVREAMRRSKA